MTKSMCYCLTAWACLALGVRADEAVPPRTHPDSSAWQDLFAKDLSNAIYPQGIWSFTDAGLTATEDQIIWTKDQYGDCIIDLEFQNGPSANSGVFVYTSNLDDWVASSIEVQILDDAHPKWAEVPKTWRCGGIFGRQAPTQSAVKKPGEWNRMTITCLGQKIYVLLNGQQVTEFDMRQHTSTTKNPDGSEIPPWISKRPVSEYPTKGHVGLQGKHGGAPIYFRNLKIKPLNP